MVLRTFRVQVHAEPTIPNGQHPKAVLGLRSGDRLSKERRTQACSVCSVCVCVCVVCARVFWEISRETIQVQGLGHQGFRLAGALQGL